MSWKPVTLNDKDLINAYLRPKRYGVSDLSFTNLYLWHFSRTITYKIIHDCLCIKTQYPDQNPFVFMPIGEGDITKALKTLIDEFDTLGIPFTMRAIIPPMIKELGAVVPNMFEFIEERDRFDYLFSAPDLTLLKGRKYHKKKNHVNKFHNTYLSCYEPIDSSNKEEVKQTWDSWYQKLVNPDQGIINEKLGIDNALEYMESLDFKGGLLRIEGKIIAFSFGEMLTDDTVVIHIEKADTSYHGAYQAINQKFLEHAWPDCTYVNREEDLGIEGLRKAKMSYHPVGFVEKHKAILKK